MYLFIASQDLRALTVALFEKTTVLQQVHLETSPELFLSEIDRCIREWDADLATLEGIAVVSGPGSFTSSRLSVTLANAIAFRFNLPIISLENPDQAPLESLLASMNFDAAHAAFVKPTYNRPPHIT